MGVSLSQTWEEVKQETIPKCFRKVDLLMNWIMPCLVKHLRGSKLVNLIFQLNQCILSVCKINSEYDLPTCSKHDDSWGNYYPTCMRKG